MNLTGRQRAAITSEERLELASMDMRLTIGETDYTALVEEFGYGAGDPAGGEPAVVLEATIAADVPRARVRKPCRVTWMVRGESFVGFDAVVVDLSESGPGTTLKAATAGFELEKISVGDGPSENLEFGGAKPHLALYEILDRAEYDEYDIPPVDKPRIYQQGVDKINWTDSLSDVTELIGEESGLWLSDAPVNIAGGYLEGPVTGETEWTFTEGLDFDFGALEVGEAGEPGERYSRVVIYKVLQNGEHERIAGARIDNAGVPVSERAVYRHELSDEDTDSAFETARRLAEELGTNEVSLSFPVSYPTPWLIRGAVIRVIGRKLTGVGVVEREYRARINTFDYTRTGGVLGAVGERVSETSTPYEEPAFSTPGAVKASYGFDYLGEPYFSDSLAWVTQDADGRHLILNVERAAADGVYVYVAGDNQFTVVVSTEPGVPPAPEGVRWGSLDYSFADLYPYTWNEVS